MSGNLISAGHRSAVSLAGMLAGDNLVVEDLAMLCCCRDVSHCCIKYV